MIPRAILPDEVYGYGGEGGGASTAAIEGKVVDDEDVEREGAGGKRDWKEEEDGEVGVV